MKLAEDRLSVNETEERSEAVKFKEFVKWCNDRAADGCLGPVTAIACISIVEEIRKLPFWKRENYWKENHEGQVLEEIVMPIEKKICELEH